MKGIGGLIFAVCFAATIFILIVSLGEHSRDRNWQREIQMIRTKADIDQRPHIMSICNTYFEWSKVAKDRVPQFEQTCAQYLTLEVSND